MIRLNRFCCVCLIKRRKLEKLSMVLGNNLSYYDKLSVLIPQVDNDEIKEMVYLCGECKVRIDNMYDFRNTYLSNNSKLRKYISGLRLDKNDLIGSNESNDTEIPGCVDNPDFDDNDMVEFELIDYNILPTGELNTEQLLSNDPLSIHIKQEESDDESIEGTEICEYVIIKDENISSSHTELSIECIRKGIPSDEVLVDNTRNMNEADVSSEKIEINLDKPSDITTDVNQSNNNDRQTNRLINNDVDAKRFKCEICNKSFNRKYNLNTHAQIHTGIKPYKCEICNKSFTKLSHLKEHNKIHTGEKPYKCEICNRSFINSSILKIHVRTHTGEKPYKCKVCSSVFPSNSELSRHNKIHSGEKPYGCDVCNKCFTFSYDLKKHSRIHTGEKPYRCEICSKSFTNNFLCRRHTRIHTGEKPYECKICNKCFNNSTHLKKHSKTHSKETV